MIQFLAVELADGAKGATSEVTGIAGQKESAGVSADEGAGDQGQDGGAGDAHGE